MNTGHIVMTRRVPRRQRGMTIIEILVVVAIIAMLASMGMVQILRARIVTHEQLAISTMRHLSKVCYFYYLIHAQFPDTLNDLGVVGGQPAFVDPSLIGDGAAFDKQGYVFTFDSASPWTAFTILGNPKAHGSTGVRHFLMDQTYAVYATEENRNATTADAQVP